MLERGKAIGRYMLAAVFLILALSGLYYGLVQNEEHIFGYMLVVPAISWAINLVPGVHRRLRWALGGLMCSAIAYITWRFIMGTSPHEMASDMRFIGMGIVGLLALGGIAAGAEKLENRKSPLLGNIFANGLFLLIIIFLFTAALSFALSAGWRKTFIDNWDVVLIVVYLPLMLLAWFGFRKWRSRELGKGV